MNRLLVGLLTGLFALVPALPARADHDVYRHHHRHTHYRYNCGYPVRPAPIVVPRVVTPVLPTIPRPCLPATGYPVPPAVPPVAPYAPPYAGAYPGYPASGAYGNP